MKLIKGKNYEELSKSVCDILVKDISKKPNLVLGFATGETPLGFYKELVSAYKKKKADFSKITSFNLDEYYPIKKKDQNSYHDYMMKHLFSKVNISKDKINFLDGDTKNPEKECLEYEIKIAKCPVDVQILGVGVNGHVGFDEPGSSINSRTRLINLTSSTIKVNSKHFKNHKMPNQALTMGIDTILRSKKIILMASGNAKREAIRHLIDGKISSKWPVSFLKKHRNLILVVDEKALG